MALIRGHDLSDARAIHDGDRHSQDRCHQSLACIVREGWEWLQQCSVQRSSCITFLALHMRTLICSDMRIRHRRARHPSLLHYLERVRSTLSLTRGDCQAPKAHIPSSLKASGAEIKKALEEGLHASFQVLLRKPMQECSKRICVHVHSRLKLAVFAGRTSCEATRRERDASE